MTYQLKHKTIGFGICPITAQPTEGIEGKFFIPSYQRGYRWDKRDVMRLLDDIWESRGAPYSLQPIVVKPRLDSPHEWELIDGQQRLTTLWLILNYMKKGGWKRSGPGYSLEYQTRVGSQKYLDELDASQSMKNIDYFHLYQANKAIDEWFDSKASNEQAKERLINQIHGYLSDSVRVIWYEAPATIESIPLFTRLNVGRIALTDAELIKASLLSEVSRQFPGREQEVAAQWDGIERDLQRDEIWAFVAGQERMAGDEKYPTRISLLLDTLADAKNLPPSKRPRYHTFDTLRDEIELAAPTQQSQPLCMDFWGKIVALHAQVLGWFEQPSIYNKIGFIIVSGGTFSEVMHRSKGKKKSEFEDFLVEQIKSTHLNVKDSDLNENLRYGKADPTLIKLLLLLNVETSRDRFPFEKHVGEHWSLEHIHAQNAQSLTKGDQWKAWLELHKNALNVVKVSANKSENDELIQEIEKALPNVNTPRFGERFNHLSSRVQKALNPAGDGDEPDHTIANLALLSHGNNAALGNAVFEVKRQMVLKLDREGKYIPICTRNVFLKYYADADAQQPHFWSVADKKSYLKEIKTKLANYLK